MELTNVNKACRLCLKICNSGFEILDEIMQCNLNYLLIYLNVAITDEPIICETCAENLKCCLDFKAKCVSTEDHITLLVCNKTTLKIDLREVYKSKIEIKSLDGSSEYNVCRLCLEVLNCGSFMYLEQDQIEMLRKYFPELDLDVIEPSVMCSLCHQSLQHHLDFIKNCLQTEGKIMEYCKVEGTDCKGQVDLSSIASFMSKNTLMTNDGVNTVKIEDICVENGGNLGISGSGTILEIKQEVKVKAEDEVELKMLSKEYESPCNGISPTQHAYKCDLCQYSAKRRYDLNQHALSHKSMSEVTTYSCDLCTFETKYKNYLRKHKLLHNSPDEATMNKCPLCEYRTKNMPNLRKHMVLHKSTSEVTMHACSECGFQTKHKNNLHKHMVTHKSTADVQMYVCKMCGFETKHKNSLHKHLLTHRSPSEVELNKCEVCDYRTKRKDCLLQHMKTHKSMDEVVSYKCEFCSYQTKRKDCLQRHVLTHKSNSEVPMFKCMLCTFESKYKNSLQKHTRVHRNLV